MDREYAVKIVHPTGYNTGEYLMTVRESVTRKEGSRGYFVSATGLGTSRDYWDVSEERAIENFVREHGARVESMQCVGLFCGKAR